MKVLFWLLILISVALGAVGGPKDTLYLAGLSTSAGAVYPNRTLMAGWTRNAAIATTAGRTASRGYWSGVANTYAGFNVSTLTNSNDWVAADYEGDVYWFKDVYDTLLLNCMGATVTDTQYIDTVYWEFTLTSKVSTIDSLRGKIQGPVLVRPKACGCVTTSDRAFGLTTVDSAPTFNKLRWAAADTALWRDSAAAGAAGIYDSVGIFGDDPTDYELYMGSGTTRSTRFDIGKYSSRGGSLDSVPIIWIPVAQAARAKIDITKIFKTGMAACASNPATMRAEGFGILMNWVYKGNTNQERVGLTLSNSMARIAVHASTAGTSMGLRIIFKTNLDGFCANTAMDTGTLKNPWYRRGGPVKGIRRNIIKQGETRNRP